MPDPQDPDHLAAQAAAALEQLGKGRIPEEIAHLKRFPFILLADTSSSTSVPFKGNGPDIEAINTAFPSIFKTLREPLPNSELALTHEQIDLSIIAYNGRTTEVMPWTRASVLPQSIPPLITGPNTSTHLAITDALQRARAYQESLRTKRIPVGLAHIIHLTDGAPTDMSPGEPKWEALKQNLATITGTADVETRQTAVVLHLITPNGCDPTFPGNLNHTSGVPTTGLEAMRKLAHPDLVYDITRGVDLMPELIRLVTGTIVGITGGKDATRVVAQAREGLPRNDIPNIDETKDA